MRLTDIAQQWLKTGIKQGDTVIDATLGNGFDALFLAQQVGANGHLYGFDVQKQALLQTQQLLIDQPCQKTFVLTGHQNMTATLPLHCQGKVAAIMFNLGWLPNSDKSVITQADTTIIALQQSLLCLTPRGKLTVMVYPGHPGGNTVKVTQWLQHTCMTSNGALHFEQVEVTNRPTAPTLLQVQKIKHKNHA